MASSDANDMLARHMETHYKRVTTAKGVCCGHCSPELVKFTFTGKVDHSNPQSVAVNWKRVQQSSSSSLKVAQSSPSSVTKQMRASPLLGKQWIPHHMLNDDQSQDWQLYHTKTGREVAYYQQLRKKRNIATQVKPLHSKEWNQAYTSTGQPSQIAHKLHIQQHSKKGGSEGKLHVHWDLPLSAHYTGEQRTEYANDSGDHEQVHIVCKDKPKVPSLPESKQSPSLLIKKDMNPSIREGTDT